MNQIELQPEVTHFVLERILNRVSLDYVYSYNNGVHLFSDNTSQSNSLRFVFRADSDLWSYGLSVRSQDISVQQKILWSIDQSFPLTMRLYSEFINKLSFLYCSNSFIKKTIDIDHLHDLTWSSFCKPNSKSKNYWDNFDDHHLSLDIYPFKNSSYPLKVRQKITIICVTDVNGELTYIPSMMITVPLSDKKKKFFYVSLSESFPCIYKLLNDQYTAISIDFALESIETSISHYIYNIIKKSFDININKTQFSELSVEDRVKFITVSEMLSI